MAKTLHVAGRTLRDTQLRDAAPLYAQQAESVPSGAQQSATGWSVKVYLGVQPQTGYHAAFVVTAGDQILAITSPDATPAQLRTVVRAPVGGGPGPSVGG